MGVGSGGTEVISSQFRIPLSPNCVMLRKYSLLDLASLNRGGERYGDDGCLRQKKKGSTGLLTITCRG